MKQVLVLVTFALLFNVQGSGQSPTWVNTIGSNSIDYAYSLDKDNAGNVYLSGRFSGTADFDPGPAIFNLTSNGLTDGYVAKYNSAGQFIWAFSIGGISYDGAQKVKINNAGEVLVTGYYRYNVDFDPGAGTFFMNGTGLAGTEAGFSGDIFVAKYTNGGNFVWAFQISGEYSHDKTEGIDVDDNDNIYIVGAVNATSATPIDADPGPAVYDIGGPSHGHGFVAKYTTNSNFIWAFSFGQYGMNSGGSKIKIIPGDTTFVLTGFFRGTSDFDPGSGVYNMTSNGAEDLIVAKYSINKTFMWAYSTGGPTADVGLEIDVDGNKDVYVTGWFNGTNIDFNPSTTAVNYLSSAGGTDSYVLKYSKNGTYLWAKSFGSTLNDAGNSLSLNGSELLITGDFKNTVDFDPGPAIYNLTSNGGSDMYVGQLDTMGNFICAENIGGLLDDIGYTIKSIAIDTFLMSGNYNTNNIDFDPSAATMIRTNAGQTDAYVSKYFISNPPLTLNPTLTGDSICQGETPSLVMNFGPGISGPYNIILSNGVTNQTYTGIQSGVPFTPIPLPTSSTTYTLVSVGTTAFTCSVVTVPSGVSATITISPSPSVTASANPPSLCAGDSTTLSGGGAASYTWSGGVSNGVPFSPAATTTYTVTGTNTSGCTATSSITVTVNLSPTITATATPSQVCVGKTTTLTGSGASSYTWSGGINNGIPFTPLIAATYTVTGTDANGCSNTSTVTISLLNNPVVISTATPPSLCAGETSVLNASGASTYAWSGGVSNGVAFTPASTATYTVTGTASNGCTATSTVSLTVHPLPTVLANANPASICTGMPTTLSGSGATSYVWTGGISDGVPFIPTTNSTYTVTGTDANGCSNTSSVSITVAGNLPIGVLPSEPLICIGDTIQLTASGATIYQWLPNSDINATNISNPLVYPSSSTTYTVTGSDASGCSGTATIHIEVIPRPDLKVTKSGDVECNIHTIQLTASGTSSYTWTPATFLSSPNSAITNAIVNTPTTFTVTGTVGTCVVTDSIHVDIYNDDESMIYIPNAFSPNDDGNNDCLRVLNTAKFTTFYFAIYNRWGQMVFESDDASKCWNGYFKNEPAMSSVYYYFLKAETRCGKIFKKGDIILIR